MIIGCMKHVMLSDVDSGTHVAVLCAKGKENTLMSFLILLSGFHVVCNGPLHTIGYQLECLMLNSTSMYQITKKNQEKTKTKGEPKMAWQI